MTTAVEVVVAPKRIHASHSPGWERYIDIPPSLSVRNYGSGNNGGSNNVPPPPPPPQQGNGPGEVPIVPTHPYARQYSNLYGARIRSLSSRCIKSATNNTSTTKGNDSNNEVTKKSRMNKICRVVELKGIDIDISNKKKKSYHPTTSIVIGTIIKTCHKRPKMKDSATEYNGGNAGGDNIAVVPLLTETYCGRSEDDIFLEDDSGRVPLCFNDNDDDDNDNDDTQSEDNSETIDTKKMLLSTIATRDDLVTGMVCAVEGYVMDSGDGSLVVSKIFLPLPGSRFDNDNDSSNNDKNKDDIADDTNINNNNGNDPHVMLVSGLGCGGNDTATTINNNNQDNDNNQEDYVVETSTSLRRTMLLDFLAGRIGAPTTTPASDINVNNNYVWGRNVSRLIVAGDGCSPAEPSYEGENAVPNLLWSKDDDDGATSNNTTNNNNNIDNSAAAAATNQKRKRSNNSNTKKRNFHPDVARSVRELDSFLACAVASGVPVDLVPGRSDPTNANWPQRPLHRCLLPNAVRYQCSNHHVHNHHDDDDDNDDENNDKNNNDKPLLLRSTNPYQATTGGRILVGTDGSNVQDLRKFLVATTSGNTTESTTKEVTMASEIEALNLTLRCGHIAPTGPDSLPTFPGPSPTTSSSSSSLRNGGGGVGGGDPFVLEQVPHLYFAGNCDNYDTCAVEMLNPNDNNDDNSATTMTRLVCVPRFVDKGEAVLVNLRTLHCQIVKFDDGS